MNYRETLNLPKTAFPMKAELTKREPLRVEWWKEQRTYERRLERNAPNGPWIFHDGPPYANGDLHMGHFLNMVLKDVFVKIALLDGKYSKFVPGWDMHGLPIEYETLKHLGITDFHAIDPLELRARCRERALFWLDRQRDQRVRMGAFGLFDRPYRTIDPSFEATIVNALADLAEKQQIYKGLRSTLWCVHDETALAEAEIEYEHARLAVDLRAFRGERRPTRAACSRRSAPRACTGKPLSFLIWTTTPWTLPANAAIALRADAEYGLYRRRRRGGDRARRRSRSACSAIASPVPSCWAARAAMQLDDLAVRHPFARARLGDRSGRLRGPAKPERAPCTRRRVTAPTTSTPA